MGTTVASNFGQNQNMFGQNRNMGPGSMGGQQLNISDMGPGSFGGPQKMIMPRMEQQLNQPMNMGLGSMGGPQQSKPFVNQTTAYNPPGSFRALANPNLAVS